MKGSEKQTDITEDVLKVTRKTRGTRREQQLNSREFLLVTQGDAQSLAAAAAHAVSLNGTLAQ